MTRRKNVEPMKRSLYQRDKLFEKVFYLLFYRYHQRQILICSGTLVRILSLIQSLIAINTATLLRLRS